MLLRRSLKAAAAHTETSTTATTSPTTAAVPQRQQPVVPPPMEAVAPVPAALQIYSRTCKAGRSHALHGRQDGERITKQFLLSGISRLELPELSPPVILTTSESITRWIERYIPERTLSPELPPVRAARRPAAPPLSPPPPASAPQPAAGQEASPEAAAHPLAHR